MIPINLMIYGNGTEDGVRAIYHLMQADVLL